MSKKAALDLNPADRRVVIYHDDNGKKFIETRQDCEHIVEAAKILSDETPGKDFRHIGFVPTEVLNQWLLDGSFNDPKKLKSWINDPDNDRFRTWRGRV